MSSTISPPSSRKSSTRSPTREIDWKELLREFWRDFSAALGDIKDLRTGQVLDSLNELLGPHIFPPRGDGADPRLCPSCGKGQLSLKLGKFGAFIGCSNYPECRFTRVLSPTGRTASARGRPARRASVLGQDPQTGEEITLRNGRFGDYVQQGEGEKPKRSSLPPGLKPEDVTLEKALALLSLPREVAKHPTSGEPILAGIGRYGPYVQHGKTYANLGRDDDVLEIGANRAIDLIVAKESGGGPRFGARTGALGEHPAGRPGHRQAGPFRPLRQPRRDQRDAAEGRGPRDADHGPGASPRSPPKRPGSFPARARSASIPRAASSPCARPLRPLCQLGQGQRQHPENPDRPTRSRSTMLSSC